MDNPCSPDAWEKRVVRVHLGQKGPAEVREGDGGQHRHASGSRGKESWTREKGEGADQRRTANRRAKGEQRRSKGWSNAKDKIEHQHETE